MKQEKALLQSRHALVCQVASKSGHFSFDSTVSSIFKAANVLLQETFSLEWWDWIETQLQLD